MKKVLVLGIVTLLADTLLLSACAGQPGVQAQVQPQALQQEQPDSPPRGQGGKSPSDRRGFISEHMLFDFESATLRPGAVNSINRLIEKYKDRYPDVNFVIEGHADARGTQDYNLDLGCRRARAVREAFIERGVPAERTLSISYGETRPYTLGDKEAAWARNRRVVIGPTTAELHEFVASLARVPSGKIRYCMSQRGGAVQSPANQK